VHAFGEAAPTHHVRHVTFGGLSSLESCVILCSAYHYPVHEGGHYRFGSVVGRPGDYPYYGGYQMKLANKLCELREILESPPKG
jgi:hypothetical protein